MPTPSRNRLAPVLVLILVCLFPALAAGHPGSGIVIDRLGQIYFVDMVSGVWKLDTHGALTHIPGPAFHWMTLDADGRFVTAQLPSNSGGDFARLGVNPTLLLASDFPIAMGRDGNLYYPWHDGGAPLQILKFLPSGRTSVLATLPAATARGPLRWINGLAAAPDGSLYYTENDAIRRISREGRLSTVVENLANDGCGAIPPREGGEPMDPPLLRGLDVDASGTIYVAATACGSVFKVTPAGQVTVLCQLPTPWAPTGVALFGNDVYVIEFENGNSDDRREMLPRVRKISLDGKSAIVATVARR